MSAGRHSGTRCARCNKRRNLLDLNGECRTCTGKTATQIRQELDPEPEYATCKVCRVTRPYRWRGGKGQKAFDTNGVCYQCHCSRNIRSRKAETAKRGASNFKVTIPGPWLQSNDKLDLARTIFGDVVMAYGGTVVNVVEAYDYAYAITAHSEDCVTPEDARHNFHAVMMRVNVSLPSNANLAHVAYAMEKQCIEYARRRQRPIRLHRLELQRITINPERNTNG